MLEKDTISAISTPSGKGGVALIRISGDSAVEVADRIFRTPGGRVASALADRRATFGSVYAPNEELAIDDVLLTVMRAPNTFTGEDTVEICCHGGVLVTHSVLAATLAAGARAATAGEFTRRAFVNGKMTLTEAESLGMLLDASSDAQVRLYRSGMLGRLSQKTSEIYDSLCAVQSSLFAAIDYPDEDLAEMSFEELVAALTSAARDCERLANTYRTGRAIGTGIPTVICGKPNAGKSSLYNLLVGYDAAIVTDVKGTTRDVLTQSVSLGAVTLRLKDTAGIRENADQIESIGIRRALDELEDAELVLMVLDTSAPPDDEDLALVEKVGSTRAVKIAILNKTDAAGSAEHSLAFRACVDGVADECIEMSALRGTGLDALRELIESKYIDGTISIGNDAVVMNARQAAALCSAMEALERATELARDGAELDMCCADVEAALIALGGIDGRAVSEDVVSGIFSHFCVGK